MRAVVKDVRTLSATDEFPETLENIKALQKLCGESNQKMAA